MDPSSLPVPLPFSSILSTMRATHWVWKNQSGIRDWWVRLRHMLSMAPTDILVTGMHRAGKTMLLRRLERLEGKALFEKPPPSIDAESAVAPVAGNVRVLTAVPGEGVAIREEVFARAFSQQGVEGVLHVVDAGFGAVMQHQDFLVKSEGLRTIADLRRWRRREELREIQRVCERIQSGFFQHQRPRWLLVVVNKADLWWGERAEIESYYSTDPESPFVQQLRGLQGVIGEMRFLWKVAPIVTWTEDFSWNGETTISQLRDETEREAMLGHLLLTIEQMHRKVQHAR